LIFRNNQRVIFQLYYSKEVSDFEVSGSAFNNQGVNTEALEGYN